MHVDLYTNLSKCRSLGVQNLEQASSPVELAVALAVTKRGSAAPSDDGLTPQGVGVGFGGWGRTAWDVMPSDPAAIRAAFAAHPDAPFVLIRHHDRAGVEWRHAIDLELGSVDQVAQVTRMGGC